MNKKCVVLIDGSNFYFKLKEFHLQNLLNCDLTGLIKYLCGAYVLIKSVYYIGKVRTDGTEKTQKLFDVQRKLFAHLKKHKIDYSLGYLLKSDGVFHEKGVDVNMAVDILVEAYEKRCDRIILVSSDTDLIPAIKKAKEKGKTVEYIGFSYLPSVALVANCSESRLLKKEDIEKFFSKPSGSNVKKANRAKQTV